jgi:6-phosphofructokinase 1
MADWIAGVIARRLKRDTRCLALSTMQQGGVPSSFDRLLAARFGSTAMRLVNEGLFGNMVAFKSSTVALVPLHQVAGRQRTVPPDLDLVRAARDLGIGFGD